MSFRVDVQCPFNNDTIIKSRDLFIKIYINYIYSMTDKPTKNINVMLIANSNEYLHQREIYVSPSRLLIDRRTDIYRVAWL